MWSSAIFCLKHYRSVLNTDVSIDVNSKSSFVLLSCECKIIFYGIILTCRLFYVLILLLLVIINFVLVCEKQWRK